MFSILYKKHVRPKSTHCELDRLLLLVGLQLFQSTRGRCRIRYFRLETGRLCRHISVLLCIDPRHCAQFDSVLKAAQCQGQSRFIGAPCDITQRRSDIVEMKIVQSQDEVMSTYIARTVVQGRKHLTKNLKLLRKLRLVVKVAVAERTDQEGSHLRLHDLKTYCVVDFEEHVISRATIHADCTTTQGY